MANRTLTYRNRINGEIGVYPEELARHFENLEEVDPDAKPLAYVPIEQEAIATLRKGEAVISKDDAINPGLKALADFERKANSTPDEKPESGEEGKK